MLNKKLLKFPLLICASWNPIFTDKVDLSQATRVLISTIRERRNNDKEC